MPFLGLLDCKAREIRAEDYCRRDLTCMHFKMSPPMDATHQLVFLNGESIRFGPASTCWGWIGLFALWWEPMDDKPFCQVAVTLEKKPLWVGVGDTLETRAGALVFTSSGLPFDDPPKEPEPKLGPVSTLMRKFRKGVRS